LPVEVEVGDRQVRVVFRGTDVFWGLTRGIVIPAECLVAARVMPQREAAQECPKLRLAGSWIPNVMRVGTFGRGERRQLWCARRAERVVVLDLTGGPYARVVLQVTDPEGLAEQIGSIIR
jgi:hypothetical protein